MHHSLNNFDTRHSPIIRHIQTIPVAILHKNITKSTHHNAKAQIQKSFPSCQKQILAALQIWTQRQPPGLGNLKKIKQLQMQTTPQTLNRT
jgi:hypothetical protein